MDNNLEVISQDSSNQLDNSASQAVESTGQQASEPIQTQEDWDYTKDSRWAKDGKTGMWKEPKDIYKSYRNMEKVYEPIKGIKTEYDNLQNVFKQHGIEPAKLNDYISEYQQLKDPRNPRNMVADYFTQYLERQDTRPVVEGFFSFLEKPEYQPYIMNFLNELQTTENQKLYPGMNAEMIAQHKAMEQKVSQFEKMFNEQKQQEEAQKRNQLIDEKIQEINNFAKTEGMTVTNEMFSELGKYCAMNGLTDPKHLMLAFKELYGKQIDEIRLKRHEAGLLKRLNKNNSNVVPNATTQNQNVTSTKGMDWTDRVNAIANRIRGVS